MRNGAERKGQARDQLGLDKNEVRLVPHDPHWIPLGRRECAAVAHLLGDAARAVAHVGSTSVPGLEAKPILDVAAAVDDDLAVDDVVARLCVGDEYAYEDDKRELGGLLFVRGHGGFRTAHVHVVGVDSPEWRSYLRFRQLLLEDPAARARYQSEKRLLAGRHAHDRAAYTHAKSAIVEELLASGTSS